MFFLLTRDVVAWRRMYVVFERKAREFHSNHFPHFVTRISLPTLKSRLLLPYSTRKSLEHQRSNAHSNVTKNLTRASRSNTGTCALLDESSKLVFETEVTKQSCDDGVRDDKKFRCVEKEYCASKSWYLLSTFPFEKCVLVLTANVEIERPLQTCNEW